MCKDYDNHTGPQPEEYWEALLDDEVNQFQGQYATKPTNRALAVWNDEGNRRMSVFEYGLIPIWAKPEDKTKMQWRFFNARDDKLMDSKLWSPCFESRRCIIPANGFFEPHKYGKEIEVPGGRKPTSSIPFYFRLKSSEVFGLAGIWSEWTDKNTGEVIKSFSIITTGPNELIKKVHNGKPRTPLILGKNDFSMWLGNVDKPEDLYDARLFQPWPDDDMEAWQIDKGLDYGKNDEGLIVPVEGAINIGESSQDQASLF